MDPYASEQEQVEQIKKWWKENGTAIMLGLVLGLGGLLGYRYYDSYQMAKAEGASINYQRFVQLAAADDADEAIAAGTALLAAYPDTAYARMTALQLARLAVDRKAPDEAEAHLQWILRDGAEGPIADLARARLARLRLEAGDPDGAAEQLAAIGNDQQFLEIRADVRAARGEVAAARDLYQQAIEITQSNGADPSLLRLKLDALGAPQAATAES